MGEVGWQDLAGRVQVSNANLGSSNFNIDDISKLGWGKKKGTVLDRSLFLFNC